MVTEALERMLAESPGVAGTPAAEVARVLAVMLDDPGTLATARVAAAREFREVLVRLGEAAPATDRMTDFEQLLRRSAA